MARKKNLLHGAIMRKIFFSAFLILADCIVSFFIFSAVTTRNKWEKHVKNAHLPFHGWWNFYWILKQTFFEIFILRAVLSIKFLSLLLLVCWLVSFIFFFLSFLLGEKEESHLTMNAKYFFSPPSGNASTWNCSLWWLLLCHHEPIMMTRN